MPNILNRESADNDHILDGVLIWIVVNNGSKDVEYKLPVIPEKIDVQDQSNNASMNILKLGEITVMQKPSLKRISWSSWFPYQDWHPLIRTKGDLFKKPSFYVSLFETLRESCTPIKLVVSGIGINCKCTIENFSWYHQGGDTEDKYYSIELKEYRDYGVLVEQTGIVDDEPSLGDSLSELQAKSAEPKDFTVGCNVILNGQLFADSYGEGAGATFKDYSCHISLINKDGTKMYHVSDSNGGSLGWVDASCLKLASETSEGTNHFESTTGSNSSSSSTSTTTTYTGNAKSVYYTDTQEWNDTEYETTQVDGFYSRHRSYRTNYTDKYTDYQSTVLD